MKDVVGKTEYLWVQFLDGTLPAGRPCPRCNGTSLTRRQEYFVHCLTCHALYVLLNRPEGMPDKRQVAQLDEFRFLSSRGEPVDEVPQGAGVLVDAQCHFFRPVAGLHLRMVVYAGRHKYLRAELPLTLAVPEAQTVQMTVGIPPGLLTSGVYAVQPWVRYSLDEMTFVSLPRPDPLPLTVNEAAADPPDPPGQLAWSVRSAHDGRPLPVAETSAMDEDEDDDED